jgi:hypothetical protein
MDWAIAQWKGTYHLACKRLWVLPPAWREREREKQNKTEIHKL